jgi:hypothetical protein
MNWRVWLLSRCVSRLLYADQWAELYDIPRRLVPAVISEWVNDGIITTRAYDGERFKTLNEWPNCEGVFANRTDRGYVCIALTVSGWKQTEVSQFRTVGSACLACEEPGLR